MNAAKTALVDALAGTELLSLAEAARLMRGRRRGQPPHVQTLRRWADPRKGYSATKDGAGPRAVLHTIRLGGDIFTCESWVRDFEELRMRLGARAVGEVRPPTERQARKAHERAERNLDGRGCK